MADETTNTAAPAAPGAPVEAPPAEATTTPPAEQVQPVDAPPPAEPTPPGEADPDEQPVTFRDRLALRQREQALAQRQSEFEATAKAVEADRSELERYRQMKKLGPEAVMDVLEEFGLDGQKVFEALKRGRGPVDPAARRALEEVERLKKEREAEKAERAKAEEQAGLQRFRAAVADTIKAGGEKLEFLAAKGQAGVEDVKEAALAYWQKHGKAPDLAKIAELVDKHYETEWEAGLKTKRAQAKLKPPAPPATPDKPAAATGAKTLSNSMDGKPPPEKREPANPRSSYEETMQMLKEIQKARGANG